MGTHIDCFVPPCPDPGPEYTRQRYLSNWDTTLTQMAGRYGAGLVLDVERGFTSDDLTDWIHPTAIGYWRMAQRIEPVVVSMLQRQAQRSPGARPAPRLPDHDGWSPPSGGTPDDGQREPRSQSEIWPGGPHEYQPWTLDRLLSYLVIWARHRPTDPEPSVHRSAATESPDQDGWNRKLRGYPFVPLIGETGIPGESGSGR